jgi:transcription initiation factor TFIID TATA-box-binding protein
MSSSAEEDGDRDEDDDAVQLEAAALAAGEQLIEGDGGGAKRTIPDVAVAAASFKSVANIGRPLTRDEIVISNLVVTAIFNCKIDLDELSWRYCGDFSPSSFAACQLRIVRPQATALCFSSGRLVATGAASESAALASVWIFYRMIKQVHPKLVLTSLQIQNIVASGDMGQNIRLDQLSAKFALDTIFDSSLFPGLRLQLSDPDVKVLLFCKGRGVVTGARTRDELQKAWKITQNICAPYLTSEPFSHASLQVDKNSKKKLRVQKLENGDQYLQDFQDMLH